MGYYSTLSIDTCVKDGCMQQVKGILAEIKVKIASHIAAGWEQELSYLTLADDGWFCCEDWYAKWYQDEKWVRKLTYFLEDGTIEFIGEDSERWGYLIEEGKAYNIKYEKTKGQLITA